MIRLATCGALALAFVTSSPAFAQPAAPGVPVSTAVAKRQDVPIFVRGIGTVQPFQSVLIRARVDGTLDKVAFTEGQDVKQGDLLATIDPRPYQAVLDQAVAKKAADIAMLSNAKRDLVRYSDLAKSDFASRQSVDTQQASVSQTAATTQADDAAIAAAKLNLDFTRITSPIDGRAGLRLVDAGNLIHANDANGLVTINQIHPIAIYFTLPQDMFPTVQDAMHAAGATPLKTTAFGGDDKRQLADGTLLTMDNAIDTSTGTIKLKAMFPNSDDRLWPGQFVNVHLQLSTTKNAVTVPSPAVQHGVNGLYVYAVQNGTVAKLVPVEVGQDNGTLTIVTKGLMGGETVVTSGQSRLTDGTKVASVSANDTGASSTSPANVGG
jgi:multidrug efflux system membrane fusion protein